MKGLYKVMLKSHTHVGCNVSEIQNQKDEHQAFQDTAKVSVNHVAFCKNMLKFKTFYASFYSPIRAHSIMGFSC